MLIEQLNNEKEWEQFIATSPEGSFFHTLKWKEVLEKSFSAKAVYLVIRDSSGSLIGICPFVVLKQVRLFKVLDSLPDSDFGGPIIKDEHAREATALLKVYLGELSAKDGIAYARIQCPNQRLYEYLKTADSRVNTTSGTMNLDLEEKPIDFIWNTVFTNKDRQRKFIRRFEEGSFQCKEIQSKEDLKEFYNLYYKNLCHIGALLHSFGFFENLYGVLYPNNFNILLAKDRERYIGALGFFIYRERKTIYLEFLGLEREIENRFHTSYYLYWEAIKWAIENGFRYISFGSTPANPNSIYHSTKIKFGASFNQDYSVFIPYNRKVFLLRENIVKLSRAVAIRLPRGLRRRLLKLGGLQVVMPW